MITTSAPELDIVEITASHNAGDACPSFALTVKPHLGTARAVTAHLAWTPPNPLTITVDAWTWECVPLDVPVRITAQDVTYQVNYYPRLMHLLRRAKLKQPAAWIAAPDWEQAVYLQDTTADAYTLFLKTADVYAAEGFTVQEILSDLGGLCGCTFDAHFPPLHVAQKSLICDEQTPILDFVGSLLPSGFRFLWDMRDTTITITLLSPPIGTTFTPPEATSLEQVTPPVETYDSVSITGAPYKLSTGLSLGGGLSSQAAVIAPAAYEETLPEETGELNGQPTRTVTTRTVQPDLYAAPFAVLREEQAMSVKSARHQRTVTTTDFECLDSVLYDAPRVVRTVKTTSGKATMLSKSVVAVSGASYLTSDLRIVTPADYAAMSPKPTVLLSAYPQWREELDILSDEKTYIQPEQASKFWPEGGERTNAQTTTGFGFLVNGRFVRASATPSAVLQEIAGHLQDTGVKTINSLTAQMKTIDRMERTLRQQGAGAYRYEETRHTLDPASGEIHSQTAMLPVNSDPPSSPTRWRTAPLTAILDATSAAGKLVLRLTGSIPTSNPRDFEVWATRLYADATTPRRVYTVATTFILPSGWLFSGGMITAWSASQKGASFSASLTIE